MKNVLGRKCLLEKQKVGINYLGHPDLAVDPILGTA